MKIDIKDCPIAEHYNDNMDNLFMFFSNGKKEFWRFDKVKKLGINKCILFFPRDFRKLKTVYSKCELVYQFKSASSVSPVYLYKNKVLIALCPLGGAASVNLMEELMFVGITQFIGVGSCGAIVPVNFEEFLIPNKAIRDEGSSYHYLPPSRYIQTSENLNNKLINVLAKHNEPYNTNIVWTTDAIYRETPKRIQARINDGAVAVEMEAASLGAVAKAKGVQYATLLYYSDYNNGALWNTRIYDKYILREKIINYAVEAILS